MNWRKYFKKIHLLMVCLIYTFCYADQCEDAEHFYYSFNSYVGTEIVFDSLNNSNYALAKNAKSVSDYCPLNLGNCIEISATGGIFISSIKPSTQLSFGGWFNISNSFSRLFYVYDTNSYIPKIQFDVVEQILQLKLNTNSDRENYIYSSISKIQLDVWNHIAFVYNPSTNGVYFYINGSLIISFYTPPSYALPTDLWQTVVFGGDLFGNGLNGYMDELNLYFCFLTQSEVATLADNNPFTHNIYHNSTSGTIIYPMPDIADISEYSSITYNVFLNATVGSILTIESVYKFVKCSVLTDVLVINAEKNSICSFDILLKSYCFDSETILIQYKSQIVSISDAFKLSWIIEAAKDMNKTVGTSINLSYNITGTNQTCTIYQQTEFYVQENILVGGHVGQLSTNNYCNKIVFHVSSSSFSIENGTIKVNDSLDFEYCRLYELKVLAFDQGSNQQENPIVFNITIHIINVNDQKPKFNQENYFVAINETNETGISILQLNAKDEDNISSIYFYCIGNDFNMFHVDNQTGVISNKDPLLQEELYSFICVVSDG
ncbi:uncharacterized protein LOC136077035 [Hydra vulgaris]|uniref:Uncharacterized protein LOC136077035 n=1 Tax=Hydra vulgaris TaxID=6087 RepID=A0ABM4BEP8_HYDVU